MSLDSLLPSIEWLILVSLKTQRSIVRDAVRQRESMHTAMMVPSLSAVLDEVTVGKVGEGCRVPVGPVAEPLDRQWFVFRLT